MVSLTDKVVVVTGASSGIGRAVSRMLVREGASVALAARRPERLEALQVELAEGPGRCLAFPSDVTVDRDVARLFDEVEGKLGPVDILINNAGRGLKARLEETSTEQWQDLMSVNLTSVYLCSREASRRMIARGTGGQIIVVSSVAGLYGGPTFSAYCAAKHGVTGFTRSIRWELRKHGIRVNAIYPARVNTEFFDRYENKPPPGQMLSPEDIADSLIAIAKRSGVRRSALALRNWSKRVWSALRFGFGPRASTGQ